MEFSLIIRQLDWDWCRLASAVPGRGQRRIAWGFNPKFGLQEKSAPEAAHEISKVFWTMAFFRPLRGGGRW